MPPIFCWISPSTFLTASLQAATTMSCNISTSPATSGSILTLSRFFWPSICTVTMPPPAEASTRIWATSCWSFSCTCCAWRIICCICCMLPGNFTWLLLEISNFADLAAKHFPEAPDLEVGQRAGGDFVFAVAGGGRGAGRGAPWARRPARRGGISGVIGGEFQAQGPAENLARRVGDGAVVEVQRVRLRRSHVQIGASDRDARVFDGVGQVRETLLLQVGVQALTGIAGGGGRATALLGAVDLERRRADARRRRRRFGGRNGGPGTRRAQLRQRLFDGQQAAGLHQADQADFQVEARLQGKLQIAEQIERELEVAAEVLFGELGSDLGQLLALGGGGGHQARIGAGDALDQQVAEVARQLAAEVLQVVAVALQFIDHFQHAARVVRNQRLRDHFQRLERKGAQ